MSPGSWAPPYRDVRVRTTPVAEDRVAVIRIDWRPLLTRDNLTEVIRAQSAVGSKILVKLVHMLAQRLRNTSMKLVKLSER